LFERFQNFSPSSRRIYHAAHLHALFSHALQMPMLQFDPGGRRAFGDEAHIDLGDQTMTCLRTGAMLIALFAALASIKFFG